MSKDAIGMALLDYSNDNYTSDIIVKSSISEDDIIPIPYLFRKEKELPVIEKKALALCKGKVLDVGAGSGCHSLILQNKGFSVAAIDTSKGAVETMVQRGLEAQCVDFYDVTDTYDTLLFLMNGVGIAGQLSQLETFLKKAKSLLKPGGQILLDSSDISYMFEEEDGSVWTNLNTGYYGEVSYQMEYKGIKTDSFDWLFVDFNLLTEASHSVGLQAEKMKDGNHHDYLARLSL